MSCRISGRLVTIPVPRGRLCELGQPSPVTSKDFKRMCKPYKSLPTIFSNTELFPLDCDPTTAICGRSIGFCTCEHVSTTSSARPDESFARRHLPLQW